MFAQRAHLYDGHAFGRQDHIDLFGDFVSVLVQQVGGFDGPVAKVHDNLLRLLLHPRTIRVRREPRPGRRGASQPE